MSLIGPLWTPPHGGGLQPKLQPMTLKFRVNCMVMLLRYRPLGAGPVVTLSKGRWPVACRPISPAKPRSQWAGSQQQRALLGALTGAARSEPDSQVKRVVTMTKRAIIRWWVWGSWP
jgi:hypothetical protein